MYDRPERGGVEPPRRRVGAAGLRRLLRRAADRVGTAELTASLQSRTCTSYTTGGPLRRGYRPCPLRRSCQLTATTRTSYKHGLEHVDVRRAAG
jgi:hypothetical protein